MRCGDNGNDDDDEEEDEDCSSWYSAVSLSLSVAFAALGCGVCIVRTRDLCRGGFVLDLRGERGYGLWRCEWEGEWGRVEYGV